MAFTLFGKVAMDSSGFHRAMTGMKAAAAPAGKQIGAQLRGSILSVFGAGAAVALFKKTLQNAFDIRKGAGKEGINTDTYQTLQNLSNRTGATVEDLAKAYSMAIAEGDEFANTIDAATEAYKEQGNIIDSETITKLAELKDKLDQLMGKFAPMIASVVDAMVAAYDKMQTLVDKALDKTTNTKAVWTPYGPVLTRLPNSAMGIKDAEDEITAPSESSDPIRAAADAATQVALAKLDEKKNKPTREKSLGDLKVSEATSVGAYFGRGMPGVTPVETKLDVLNREVKAINMKIASFR